MISLPRRDAGTGNIYWLLTQRLVSLLFVTSPRSKSPASRQSYHRRRARQIAYGRWEPWTQAAPVQDHLRRLCRSGVSIRAIGRAAGVSPTTVHRLLNDSASRRCHAQRHLHTTQARRLLVLTPATVEQLSPRRNAVGAQRRLRALTAIGYPAVALAAQLGVAPSTVRKLLSGHAKTVSPPLNHAVRALYDQVWDQPPAERTGAERRAATAARTRAAHSGWPAPMGLDDDRIDDPSYRPRAHWRPVACATSSRRASDRARTPIRRAVAPGHAHQGRGR